MGVISLDKREKVIKGLYHISNDTRLKGFMTYWGSYYDVATDAIALLKAQEPRVMTLDELSEKTDVWFESLVYGTIAPALSSGSYDDGTVGLMTLEEESFYMDEADYGTKWRCWTSRPDEKRRAETPWES